MQKTKKIYINPNLQQMLFPLPIKLTPQSIHTIIPYFTIEKQINLDKYKEIMKKWCDKQMEGIYWAVKAQSNNKVYPRVIAIILFLQLVGYRTDKKDTAWGFNQSFKQSGVNFSPLSSPRSKTTRTLYFTNQQTSHVSYITCNLKIFLRIISSDPLNQNPMLTPQQLNYLSILFKTDKNKSLASMVGLNGKMSINQIYQLMKNRININQDILCLQNLTNIVAIKEHQFMDKDVRVVQCSGSYIYFDTPINSLQILNCTNTTVYVSACTKITLLDKCQRVSLTIATGLLRISNTIDSFVHYYGINPPILTGDNRGIIFGPNNSSQKKLLNHLKHSNIPVQSKYTFYFENPLCLPYSAHLYTTMQVSDFNILVFPNKSQQNKNFLDTKKDQLDNMILTPQLYKNELMNRYKYFQDLKIQIRNKGMNQQKNNNLHWSIQGHFRQWLVGSGAIKNINDLVKMMQQ